MHSFERKQAAPGSRLDYAHTADGRERGSDKHDTHITHTDKRRVAFVCVCYVGVAFVCVPGVCLCVPASTGICPVCVCVARARGRICAAFVPLPRPCLRPPALVCCPLPPALWGGAGAAGASAPPVAFVWGVGEEGLGLAPWTPLA